MPEGPSIVIFKNDIQRFQGKKVKAASGTSKTVEPTRLVGKTITNLNTHGKHLLISFGKDLTLRVHFLMFGTYRFDDSKAAPKQLHLEFARNQQLNFYTCSLRFIEGDLDEVYDWRIDIMREEFDQNLALKHLKNLPEDSLICDALLDQTIFAGLGNIIKNEVLYRTEVQPESLVSAIPLKKKKEIIQDVVDYTQLFYEWRQAGVLKKHWQAHTRKTCPQCRHKLIKEYLGKTKRRSFYCLNCQELYV